MSKIHILTADTTGNYQIVIHTPTPTGNNSIGTSWKTSGINSKLIGTTSLTIGTGPGQISSTEQSQIIAGDVIEIIANIPAESDGATTQSLNEMANQLINQKLNDFAKQLKYFGYVQD